MLAVLLLLLLLLSLLLPSKWQLIFQFKVSGCRFENICTYGQEGWAELVTHIGVTNIITIDKIIYMNFTQGTDGSLLKNEKRRKCWLCTSGTFSSFWKQCIVTIHRCDRPYSALLRLSTKTRNSILKTPCRVSPSRLYGIAKLEEDSSRSTKRLIGIYKWYTNLPKGSSISTLPVKISMELKRGADGLLMCWLLCVR